VSLGAAVGGSVLGHRKDSTGRSSVSKHRGGDRRSQGTVRYDAQRVLPGKEADRQARVVLPRCTGADHYRVVLGAQGVGKAKRFW
jgi:hypothetical protein